MTGAGWLRGNSYTPRARPRRMISGGTLRQSGTGTGPRLGPGPGTGIGPRLIRVDRTDVDSKRT